MRANITHYYFLFILLLLPIVLPNNYILNTLTMAFLYAMLSMSLNIITGITGQFCIGHAGFYAIGAYSATLLLLELNYPFLLATLIAGFMAAFFGLLLGLLATRIKGIYLCIVTLGFNEIITTILLNSHITRGAMGITSIPTPQIGQFIVHSTTQFYYLFFIFFMLTFFIIYRLENSKFGILMYAVNNDELAAQCSGIHVNFVKVIAFMLGAFFAGISGSLFACHSQYISPNSFGFIESITILCMVMLGGKGNTKGAIIGAFILVIIPEFLRIAQDYRLIIYGFVLILTIIIKPEGIYGIKYRQGISS